MTFVVHQLVYHSPVAFMVCVSLCDDLRGPLVCISCLIRLCITGSLPGHITSVHEAGGVLTWTVQHADWWVQSEQLECHAIVSTVLWTLMHASEFLPHTVPHEHVNCAQHGLTISLLRWGETVLCPFS